MSLSADTFFLRNSDLSCVFNLYVWHLTVTKKVFNFCDWKYNFVRLHSAEVRLCDFFAKQPLDEWSVYEKQTAD